MDVVKAVSFARLHCHLQCAVQLTIRWGCSRIGCCEEVLPVWCWDTYKSVHVPTVCAIYSTLQLVRKTLLKELLYVTDMHAITEQPAFVLARYTLLMPQFHPQLTH